MLTDRDNHLWLQLWRDRKTDFHQKAVNRLLTEFWSSLNHAKGSRVFVPLCGKSLDMLWLAKQGHEVMGVELSPIAVRAFFRENRMQPVKRRMGKYTLWQHGSISILCGDYFSLTKADLGHIDTVYDRAALTALPEDIRKLYVEQLGMIVPETADIFLLTIEDAEEDEGPDQERAVDQEVCSLYSERFDITLAQVESVYESEPAASDQARQRTDYKAYRLTSRADLR